MEYIGCLFLILMFPVGIIYVLIKSHLNKGEINDNRYRQNQWLARGGIVCEIDLTWTSTLNDVDYRFIVDDYREQVIIFDGVENGHVTRINYSEIIGFETITNDHISGGVGRAIVGGVLAGGVGAIVGASTRKSKISSYKAIIYKNNVVDSSYVFRFITSEVNTDNSDYKSAMIFSEEVGSTIKAIIAANEKNKNKKVSADNPSELIRINTKGKEMLKEEPQAVIEGTITKNIVVNPTDYKFCSQCGKRLAVNARFCWSCGAEVNIVEQENTKGTA